MVITIHRLKPWKHIQCNFKVPLEKTELMKKLNQYFDQQQINEINQCHHASIKQSEPLFV